MFDAAVHPARGGAAPHPPLTPPRLHPRYFVFVADVVADRDREFVAVPEPVPDTVPVLDTD